MIFYARVVDGQLVNEYGEPFRSKWEYPYSYDPICLFSNGMEADRTAYHDRMMSWKGDRRYHLSTKMFGNTNSYWCDRDPKTIQQFLREYFEDPELILCKVIEYCNPSNGFPYWRFDYQSKKE